MIGVLPRLPGRYQTDEIVSRRRMRDMYMVQAISVAILESSALRVRDKKVHVRHETVQQLMSVFRYLFMLIMWQRSIFEKTSAGSNEEIAQIRHLL